MTTRNFLVKQVLMSILTAATMTVGFTACSDDLAADMKSHNNTMAGDNENSEAVIGAEQGYDEMTVRVTRNVDGAVMSNFDDNSVGAALARRLPVTSGAVDKDTRLILVSGNDIARYTGDMRSWAAAYLNGGSIAVEQPTGEQMNALANALAEELAAARTAQLTADGDIVIKTRGNRRSQSTYEGELLKARVQNVKNFATTRSGVADAENGIVAELVIFSPDGCYQYLAANNEENKDGSMDQDGMVNESAVTPAKSQATAYRSGLIADGAALWLMDDDACASKPVTRGDAESSINELMSCSDQFTVESYLRTHDWRNQEISRNGCFRTTYKVWGVNDHGDNANTDYYYVKQNTLIRVGGKVYDNVTGNGFYDTFYWGAYDPQYYRTASNWENGHNLYYGSWLDKYESSMELTGNGTISIEQALPSTDNNTGSQTIAIGTNKSQNDNIGFSFTGAESPSFGLNYSHGWSKGTSFTMSYTTVAKDLKVVKNSNGNRVTWTYENGQKMGLYTNNKNKICHYLAPDAVTNDVDLENQICWSVKNPSGRYTIEVRNFREMRCLTKKKDDGKKWTDWWFNTTRSDDFTLLEPNRAEQVWHFDVTPSTLGKEGHNGDKQKLTDALMKQFPEVFQTLTRVADRTIDSENAIQYTVAYAKSIINDKNGGRTMREYALDLGCESYTIRWYCMEGNHNEFELTINVK